MLGRLRDALPRRPDPKIVREVRDGLESVFPRVFATVREEMRKREAVPAYWAVYWHQRAVLMRRRGRHPSRWRRPPLWPRRAMAFDNRRDRYAAHLVACMAAGRCEDKGAELLQRLGLPRPEAMR